MGQDHESMGRRDALRRVAGAGAVGAAAWAAPAVTGMSVVPRLAQAQSGGGGGPGGGDCPGELTFVGSLSGTAPCVETCSLTTPMGEEPTINYQGNSIPSPLSPLPAGAQPGTLAIDSVYGGLFNDPPALGQPTTAFLAALAYVTTSDCFGNVSGYWSLAMAGGGEGTWTASQTFRLPTGLSGSVEAIDLFSLPSVAPYSTPAGTSVAIAGTSGGEYTFTWAPDPDPTTSVLPNAYGAAIPAISVTGNPTGDPISLDYPKAFSTSWNFVVPAGTTFPLIAGSATTEQDWALSYNSSCDIPATQILATMPCTI